MTASMATTWPHLETRDDGRLWIKGTQIKMLEVVLDHLVHRMTVDQIVREFPPLTHSQVHAALGYYYDDQEAVEQAMEQQEQRYLDLRKESENPELQAKLARFKANAT
jgi:uncharacterized protein (DUF433 family)